MLKVLRAAMKQDVIISLTEMYINEQVVCDISLQSFSFKY